MKVSVLIPTFGNPEWCQYADRAYDSADGQGALEILTFHDPEGTISSVRNELARTAKGDWLLFLDADDQIAPGFLAAMERAFEQDDGRHDGVPLLLTPARSYVIRGRKTLVHFEAVQDLRHGNWLPIGTLISKYLFQKVGGFNVWPVYEDWDLWMRCALAGAEVKRVKDAVYLAHVRKGSRNRNHSREQFNYWHQKIGHSNCPDLYDSPTPEEDASQTVAGVRKMAWAYS